jgi:hypothetical protein
MEWYVILALVLAAFVVLLPLVFIWFTCIGGICVDIKRRRKALLNVTCSVDTDCPTGYACVGGRCIPQNA